MHKHIHKPNDKQALEMKSQIKCTQRARTKQYSSAHDKSAHVASALLLYCQKDTRLQTCYTTQANISPAHAD